jgi:hypothetical protein
MEVKRINNRVDLMGCYEVAHAGRSYFVTNRPYSSIASVRWEVEQYIEPKAHRNGFHRKLPRFRGTLRDEIIRAVKTAYPVETERRI